MFGASSSQYKFAYRCQLFSVYPMVRTRIRVQNNNQPTVRPCVLANLHHTGYISCLFINDVEKDLTCYFRLMLQLYHLWFPVGLLRIVECDALTFEVRNRYVLSPSGRVARTSQENVICRCS